MEIFLFTLVRFSSKPASKSSVLSKVGCLYCNSELHPGKSFQIPEGLDSAPFYNQWWYYPLFQQRQNQDGDCFTFTRTILQVVHSLHPILRVSKEQGYLPHIFLLGIPYVSQLRIQWSSLTTYVQTIHSSILKSGEKWIWSLSLFRILCKASNSSVSRVLFPPEFLVRHSVFLISRTVHSLVSVGWTSLVC